MSFWDFLRNIVTSEECCDCHGDLRQIDAELPDGTPVRIMESVDGYHVSVGEHDALAPQAIAEDDVIYEIYNQWSG